MNPRDGSPPYSLSRGAPSASWVLLQVEYTIQYRLRMITQESPFVKKNFQYFFLQEISGYDMMKAVYELYNKIK